jgi:HEAT repeat protein
MMPRSRMLQIAAWLFIAPLLAATAEVGESLAANSASSSQQRAAWLVRQLGDSSYAAREQAARDLELMGWEARPALAEALDDPNLEIRYRAQRLLEAIEQADHQRRVDEFLKNPTAASDDVLPGWRRYRALVGDGEHACRLFAEMQQAEGMLFRLSERDGAKFEAEFAKRCLETLHGHSYGHGRQAALGTLAALVFFASEPGFEFSNRTAGSIYSLVYQNEFRKALTGEEYAQAARGILAEWIRQPDSNIPYQKITLAMQHDLKSGLVPALELIRSETQPPQLQYAICAVGKLGGPEHVADLETLFGNDTVLTVSQSNNKTTYSCEVRDVALAAALHLTKQKPSEYGYNRLRTNPQSLFSMNSAGFDNPDDRDAAFQKWQDWKSGYHDFTAPSTTECGR